MLFLKHFWRQTLARALEMSWGWTITIVMIHAITTYVGFSLLGEMDLISDPIQFIYFYVVTGSSVGYGDFSPASSGGKLFAALWVIPGALSLFAFLLGKVATSIALTVRLIMNGRGDFSDKTGHVVIVGHVPGQTEQLLDEAKRFQGRQDVIVVTTHDIDTASTLWKPVRATTLSNQEDLKRAGIQGAGYVVILGQTDDESLAASMAVGALCTQGHVVAYFREQGPADIVEAHCPNIETVVSISVQMVARALVDPGAGEAMMALASSNIGATLYSTPAKAETDVKTMRAHLSAQRASLIGFRAEARSAPNMAMSETDVIPQGATVYYISDARLEI